MVSMVNQARDNEKNETIKRVCGIIDEEESKDKDPYKNVVFKMFRPLIVFISNHTENGRKQAKRNKQLAMLKVKLEYCQSETRFTLKRIKTAQEEINKYQEYIWYLSDKYPEEVQSWARTIVQKQDEIDQENSCLEYYKNKIPTLLYEIEHIDNTLYVGKENLDIFDGKLRVSL